MIPCDFDYYLPDTWQEAVDIFHSLKAEGKNPLYYGGGTKIISMARVSSIRPDAVIDIKKIPECQSFGTDGSKLFFGAALTLTTIRESGLYPLLSHAAGRIADHTVQCKLTLGGNLAQHPRCWYYRNALTHCWRKGGQMCYAFRGENRDHAILGGGPCYAVHPSDPAVALLALDALVTVAGPEGARTVPLGELHRIPRGQRFGRQHAISQADTHQRRALRRQDRGGQIVRRE